MRYKIRVASLLSWDHNNHNRVFEVFLIVSQFYGVRGDRGGARWGESRARNHAISENESSRRELLFFSYYGVGVGGISQRGVACAHSDSESPLRPGPTRARGLKFSTVTITIRFSWERHPRARRCEAMAREPALVGFLLTGNGR